MSAFVPTTPTAFQMCEFGKDGKSRSGIDISVFATTHRFVVFDLKVSNVFNVLNTLLLGDIAIAIAIAIEIAIAIAIAVDRHRCCCYCWG